jgi:hypothetical protein
MSQPNATEPTGSTLANGVIDKDTSSPLDEIRSEKTDDISGVTGDVSQEDFNAMQAQRSLQLDEEEESARSRLALHGATEAS